MDQKKKNRLEQLRDWWETLQIRRRRHQSLWYLGYAFFVILSYSIMFGFGLFIESNDDLSSSKVGQTFTIGTDQYELVEKKVNLKSGKALFAIANAKATVSDLTKELKATIEFLDSSGEKSHLELLSGDKGYYVVSVNSLPEKWKAFRISLEEKGTDEPTSATIVVSHKEEKSTSFEQPSEESVFIASLDYQIKLKEKAIVKKEKAIQKNTQSIEERKEKITLIQNELAYQTETEQKQSEGAVKQINDSITQTKGENSRLEKEIRELNEQTDKINLRIQDLKK